LIHGIHVLAVAVSGSLFLLRGLLVLSGRQTIAMAPFPRILSYLVDTTLLVSAIVLTVIVHQYPFVNSWLTVKVLLLVVYIVLGIFALKRARSRAGKAWFFVAALATFAFIISVAITHRPLGVFYWLLNST
jgi:uncharacterized membrane protein SirB2